MKFNKNHDVEDMCEDVFMRYNAHKTNEIKKKEDAVSFKD
jgi:hypothetical protein